MKSHWFGNVGDSGMRLHIDDGLVVGAWGQRPPVFKDGVFVASLCGKVRVPIRAAKWYGRDVAERSSRRCTFCRRLRGPWS